MILKKTVYVTSDGLISTSAPSNALSQLVFKRGDTVTLNVIFLDEARAPVALEDGYVITMAVKPTGEYDTDVLYAYSTVTVAGQAASTGYSFSLNLNNTTLAEAFQLDEPFADDVLLILGMLELSWTNGGNIFQSTQNTAQVLINNDVIRGDEATPLALPSPETWLTNRTLRFDTLQSLSDIQKARAHANLGLPKTNWTATSAPTLSNDSSQGYTIGSLWLDVTNKEAYRCLDNTIASADWIDTTLDASEVAGLISVLDEKTAIADEKRLPKIAKVSQVASANGLATSKQLTAADSGTVFVVIQTTLITLPEPLDIESGWNVLIVSENLSSGHFVTLRTTGATQINDSHADLINDVAYSAMEVIYTGGGYSVGVRNTRDTAARILTAADITSGTFSDSLLPTDIVRTADARLSDARTPVTHTHSASDLTSGTLSATLIPTEIVRTTDDRLSDARTPVAHTHATADVTGLATSLDGKLPKITNTSTIAETVGGTTSVQLTAANSGTIFRVLGNAMITLPAQAGLPVGWSVGILNEISTASSYITLAGGGSSMNGATTVINNTVKYSSMYVLFTGSSFVVLGITY